MMRNIYDCDTGKASHQFARVSENVPSVPGFPEFVQRGSLDFLFSL